MKKLLIFFVAVFLFSACNNNGGIGMGGGGWSSSEKSGFMKQCTETAATGLGEEKAKQYCACTMDKIQKKYPKYSDANAAPNEEITAIGRSCANGMNGGNNGEDNENNGDDFNMNGKKKNKNDDENYGNNDDNGGFNNNKGANWSKSDKNSWMNQCQTALANSGNNSNQSRELCNCILGKLQKKYSSLSDADRRGGTQAGQMARQECENGGGGGDDDNDDNDNY